MNLQQLQSLVDSGGQAELLRQLLHRSDPAGRDRPVARGHLVVDVLHQEHRLVLQRPDPVPQTMFDPILAPPQLARDAGLRSKRPSQGQVVFCGKRHPRTKRGRFEGFLKSAQDQVTMVRGLATQVCGDDGASRHYG